MGTVNTKAVGNRREVHYGSFADLVADVEVLSRGEYRTLGNWTFPQIVEHLARAIAISIDGAPFQAPWWMRKVGILFLKKRF